jgi:diaminopimelate decarboxylase
MIWFFEREGARRLCEFRLRADAPGYELEWVDQGGNVHVERSEDADHLSERLKAIEELFQRDGWRRLPE